MSSTFFVDRDMILILEEPFRPKREPALGSDHVSKDPQMSIFPASREKGMSLFSFPFSTETSTGALFIDDFTA